MCKYTKLLVLVVLSLLLGSTRALDGAVTFNRFTVGSGLNTPHGDWAGDIDGTSPSYVLDIFATIQSNGKAVWYANNGDGTSWSSQNHIWTSTPSTYNTEIAGADFDGDGNVDAVSCEVDLYPTSRTYLAVHKNNGGGTSFTTKIIGDLVGRFRQMRVRDVDADSDIDIVVAVNTQTSQSGIGLYWYENTGGMNFTEHFIGKCNPWKVDCFDDDGDGHLEIVVGEAYHGSVAATPCRLILYKNNGSESFTQVVIDNDLSYTTGSTSGYGSSGVRCADFNNDGKIDIVCGDQHDDILCWYENLGGSSFAKDTIDNNCPNIDGVDVGDFEPDGDMDIVAAGRDHWFKWYENDGSGNFTPHTIDTDYEYFDLPYVTYLDGDSCPDIVLTESSSNGRIFAYLNKCPTATEEAEITPAQSYLKVPSIITSEFIDLEYGIEKRGNVRLEIIDITGRTVQVIENNSYKEPGTYKIGWNIRKEPNGVYFLKLNTGNNSHIVKKVIVIK